jgi:hypothetical protein
MILFIDGQTRGARAKADTLLAADVRDS